LDKSIGKMEENSQNTEAQILQAARKVFIEKGLEGTRMQEIADEAGINKALLHYYFRSKDKLFHAVFIEAFQKFLPQIDSLILTQAPVALKLEAFITNYINTIIENPFIPGFVLHELTRDPQSLAELLKSRAPMVPAFLNQIKQEIEAGNLKPFDPKQIIINMLALCIFPFVARPIAQTIFFENNADAYNHFLEERKTEVFNFIKSAILIEKS
jgi:AcrR family transcriptional regulator